MFTGIVQGLGQVIDLAQGVLSVQAPAAFAPEGFDIGESIAVNGCCLTVVADASNILRFDLSPETLARTALGALGPGGVVNLERAMRASDRFGGHIVQGHVDAVGTVVSKTPQENATIVRFQVPPEFDRYLIDKGSITIDGISLTVVKPEAGAFDTWIIPHTLEQTNLGTRQAGDAVNLEFDVLAKYVEKLMGHAR